MKQFKKIYHIGVHESIVQGPCTKSCILYENCIYVFLHWDDEPGKEQKGEKERNDQTLIRNFTLLRKIQRLESKISMIEFQVPETTTSLTTKKRIEK